MNLWREGINMPIQRRKVNRELTEIQQQVYDYIVKYISENGYAPSYKEIATTFNHSASTIHAIVKRIERRGLIVTKDCCPRAIKVVGYKFVKDEQ